MAAKFRNEQYINKLINAYLLNSGHQFQVLMLLE